MSLFGWRESPGLRKVLAGVVAVKLATLLGGLYVLFGLAMPTGWVFVDLALIYWFAFVAVGAVGLYGERVVALLPERSVEALRAEARALITDEPNEGEAGPRVCANGPPCEGTPLPGEELCPTCMEVEQDD